MFLLVFVRHVVTDHPGEHQHGGSIQISMNLGNISSDISYTKYCSDLNLGEGLCICTSFHFTDFGLYLLNGLDFYFIYFKWSDTENQQFSVPDPGEMPRAPLFLDQKKFFLRLPHPPYLKVWVRH